MAASDRIHGYVHEHGEVRKGKGSYVSEDGGDNRLDVAFELAVTAEQAGGKTSSGNTIAMSPALARKVYEQLGQLLNETNTG